MRRNVNGLRLFVTVQLALDALCILRYILCLCHPLPQEVSYSTSLDLDSLEGRLSFIFFRIQFFPDSHIAVKNEFRYQAGTQSMCIVELNPSL